MEQSKLMARLAYQALDDKKGEDIQVIDISQVSVLADYFIIANGNSESQGTSLSGYALPLQLLFFPVFFLPE